MDVEEPLKRIVNPKNLVDRIEDLKYSIPDGASQYVGQLDQLAKTTGEQSIETLNLEQEGNMPADLVNVDWWLPLNLANDDVAEINTIKYDGSEYVYVGGDFKRIGGIDASNIARYSLVTRNWEEVGGGLNDQVRVINISSTGGVYVGGDFINAGGVAAADYLALYTGTSFTNVVTSITGTSVYDIAFDSNDVIYVGGDFTAVNGSTNGSCVFKIDSSTVEYLSAGLGSVVYTLKVSADNATLYAGGLFSNAGGVAEADRLAKWASSAWGAVSTDIVIGTEAVYDIELDASGNLYVGGAFDDGAGANVNHLFKFDGTTITSLLSTTSLEIRKICMDYENSILYVVNISPIDGEFTLLKYEANDWITVSSAGELTSITGGLRRIDDILLMDSGSLLVGGIFNYAGSVFCNSFVSMTHPLSEAIDILSSLFELYSSANFNLGGWTPFYSNHLSTEWIYASASTFTVAGDFTNVFTKDTRLKFTQPTLGQKYAVVVGSSYSDPNTTVTILVNTDYVIANENIEETFISYEMSPAGYPRHFNFTPTYNNVTVGNGTRAGKVSIRDGHVKGWASFEWAATTDTPTSAFTGSVSLVPPVTESTDTPSRLNVGGASMFDSSVPSVFDGDCILVSGNIELRASNASATHSTIVNANGTVPMTWAGGDNFRMDFEYPYG